MSLKHVLLGSLSERPLTGFDLKKVVDGAISHFWRAELSQIYPTLKRLQEEGMVTCDVQTRNKVYHITDAGRAELVSWLKAPAELTPQREAFLVRIYFGSHLSTAELRGVITEQRAKHEAQLAEYERALTGAKVRLSAMDPETARDFRVKLLTLRGGVQYHRFWIVWCDEALSEVGKLPELPTDEGRDSGRQER